MKKIFLLFGISILLGPILMAQDSVNYVMKCRMHNAINKYNCITLKLLPQNKYYYEELAGGLAMEISQGDFLFKQDTLVLIPNKIYSHSNTQNINDQVFKKYIKVKNMLIDINNKNVTLKSKGALTASYRYMRVS